MSKACKLAVGAGLTLFLWSVAPAAVACEVCLGASDAPAVQGMNNAILFLLAIIGLVQVGFVKLFWEFRKRSRSIEERKEQFRIVQGGLR